MSSPPSNTARPPPQPLLNPKYRHISRSAAKRESVQLLGSIKDLQRHFLQAASIEHRPGAGVGVKGLDTLGEEEENRDPAHDRSANAAGGPSRERRPWKEVELQRVDVETARKEVKGIIGDLRGLWDLGGGSAGNSPTTPTFGQADTQQLLVRTARSIRRVRELSLSTKQSNRRVSSGVTTAPRPKQARASISTPSRPAMTLPRAVSASGSTLPARRSSLGVNATASEAPDAALRRAAMEVLAGLRGMEERLRIDPASEGSRILDPNAGPVGARSVSASSAEDPSRPSSSMSVLTSEPESVNEQEEEEWNMNILAADGDLHRHIETWEERIAAEGREYRAVGQGEAAKERDSVRRWLGIAEGVFRGTRGQTRGKWAEGDWEGRQAERIRDFLAAHLALDLSLHLPETDRPDFRQALLSRLSDGFILIHALNTALHASPRSWGFVPEEDIHDTLNAAPPTGSSGSVTPEEISDERSTEGWTFRRIGNLTAWAAALRQRYHILLTLPIRTTSSAFLHPPTLRSSGRPSDGKANPRLTPPLSAATPSRKAGDVPPYHFDPTKIAKREEGWEGELEGLIMRWIEDVVAEVEGGGSGREVQRGGMV